MSNSEVAAAILAAKRGNGFAVYGTGEPEAHKLARTYQALRERVRHFEGRPPHAKARDPRRRYARTYTAAEAMAEARRMVSAGDRLPWPTRGLASYQNKPNDRGGRWIERPDLAGLRFVGFADELNRHIGHKGWFQYPGGDPGDVYRGVVYRMPARGGRSVYVEAIVSGEDTRGGFRETSTCGSDESKWPAIVYLSERHAGGPGGAEGVEGDDSAIRDAASGADSEAERLAESERDYQESYAFGREAAEAIEEAKAERESARAILAEIRGLRGHATLTGGAPALCAALREVTGQKLRRARRKYAKAAELWAAHGEPVTWRPDLADAFAEAAGAASYWESRK